MKKLQSMNKKNNRKNRRLKICKKDGMSKFGGNRINSGMKNYKNTFFQFCNYTLFYRGMKKVIVMGFFIQLCEWC